MAQLRFYTTERIGNKRGLTPEGFLICYDVPLARTGIQLYAEGEVPVPPGPDGLIRVERPPEEVFRPETMASFNGKLVVIEHPVTEDEGAVDVNSSNWKEFASGSVQNVRKGTGAEPDVMLGDIILYDPEAISLVNSGKMRQVCCGYDAEYEVIGPGRAVQTDIVGNHVALVGEGRCGPVCAIRDASPFKQIKREEKELLTIDRAHPARSVPKVRRFRHLHFYVG